MPEDIWARNPRSDEVRRAEADAVAFLDARGLPGKALVEGFERACFDAGPGGEDRLLDDLLAHLGPGSLADLARFDAVFRRTLFPHVPQRALGGLSPVRYALFLRKMQDGS